MLDLRAAILVLVLGYASAQSPGCDYYQVVQPGQTYYAYSPNYPNNYTGTISCRWIGSCPPGYNCKLECTEVYIPYTQGCTTDRLLISKTGDPLLAAAQTYCGNGQITVVSDLQQISLGLMATNSRGGRFFCRLTAVPASVVDNCRCGYKKTNRIVGGQETGVNEFPMMVALADRSISEVKCGGVIIDKRWVMTAAHCLVTQTINNIAVIVGEHDTSTGSDTNAVQGFAPKRFIIHPNFNQNNYDNDIALIELNSDIMFNDRVGPVCLPFKFATADFSNTKFTALGMEGFPANCREPNFPPPLDYRHKSNFKTAREQNEVVALFWVKAHARLEENELADASQQVKDVPQKSKQMPSY
ncbi:venom serine protease 34-like [Hyposmocoma kahamanoa]|uniref:venom serine protease 34-like n=1 Tax=Hyposmocoma kahamanoa TaxID=1477025 RepID=UPI000E6D8277|nr:venom serine protease 34-like [Hyposmocoma kahamanoa]